MSSFKKNCAHYNWLELKKNVYDLQYAKCYDALVVVKIDKTMKYAASTTNYEKIKTQTVIRIIILTNN